MSLRLDFSRQKSAQRQPRRTTQHGFRRFPGGAGLSDVSRLKHSLEEHSYLRHGWGNSNKEQCSSCGPQSTSSRHTQDWESR